MMHPSRRLLLKLHSSMMWKRYIENKKKMNMQSVVQRGWCRRVNQSLWMDAFIVMNLAIQKAS